MLVHVNTLFVWSAAEFVKQTETLHEQTSEAVEDPIQH